MTQICGAALCHEPFRDTGPENHCPTILCIVRAELPPVCAPAWWGVKATSLPWREINNRATLGGCNLYLGGHVPLQPSCLRRREERCLVGHYRLTQDSVLRKKKQFFQQSTNAVICDREEDVNSTEACHGLVEHLPTGSNVLSSPHLSGIWWTWQLSTKIGGQGE